MNALVAILLGESIGFDLSENVYLLVPFLSQPHACVQFFCRCTTRAPAGAEHGPHGKLRAGDLVFLADFSEKTLTGVFEADCSPRMNLEYDAFGGAYPWQVRIRKRNANYPKPSKISLSRAFALMHLEFGARLNLLSRSQLASLLQSAEFAPCVPARYIASKKQTTATVITPPTSGSSSLRKQNFQITSAPPSYRGLQKPASQTNNRVSASEEHPATSLARLKALMSWLHKFTKVILDKNSKHRLRRDSHAESPDWKNMQYNDVHSGVSYIFNQWLFAVHAIGVSENTCNAISNLDSSAAEKQKWSRAGSKSGIKKEIDDPVLLVSFSPLVTEKVRVLFKRTCGPSVLNIPTEALVDEFTRSMAHKLETIENEVKTTQRECLRLNGRLESTHLDIRVFPNEFDNDEVTLQWRTKSSSKANRPAPSQTIYRVCFDKLCKRYYSKNDPNKKLMLTRIFVLLCRYVAA